MSTFHLKIIAYDKIFYDDEAASVVLPAIDGEVQILTNHEECVVALKTGEVRIGTPKGEMIPAVCGSGFAEVTSDNQVEILVDTIERPEEIDIRRAKEAKERGQCFIFVIHGWFEYNEKSSNRSCQKRQNKQNGPTCQIQCRIQIEPPVGGYKNNHKNSDCKCKQPDFFSCE